MIQVTAKPDEAPVSLAERSAKLRADKAKRDGARQEKREREELEELELEAKFDTELGPRGVAFEIVDATHVDCGFIVVKLGEKSAHKRFTNSKLTETDVHEFVTPSVAHPELKKYLEIASVRGEIPGLCAAAIMCLHGARVKGDAGK